MNEERMQVIKLERKLKQLKKNTIAISLFSVVASCCLGIQRSF